MPMHEASCIEDPSFFVVSLLCCQLVSSSLDCFPCLDIRTLWLKFVSSLYARACFMRTVSVASDLFDFSIHFLSFFIISLITLLFLLPDTFSFHDVVDKYPAHFRWGPSHPGRERSSHRLWAQRRLHCRGLCRIHPGVLERAAVPWWLRLRWRHHRQDAPWCVPKTSRSLRRRPVVQSVVVRQSW